MKEWIRINNLFTADDVAKGHLLVSLPLEAARIARWPYTMVFASSLPGVGSTCRDAWPNRHANRCAWHIPAFGCWHWQHLPKWHLVKVTWNDMEDGTLVPAMRRFWKENNFQALKKQVDKLFGWCEGSTRLLDDPGILCNFMTFPHFSTLFNVLFQKILFSQRAAWLRKGWLTNETLQLFHFFVLPRQVELLLGPWNMWRVGWLLAHVTTRCCHRSFFTFQIPWGFQWWRVQFLNVRLRWYNNFWSFVHCCWMHPWIQAHPCGQETCPQELLVFFSPEDL